MWDDDDPRSAASPRAVPIQRHVLRGLVRAGWVRFWYWHVPSDDVSSDQSEVESEVDFWDGVGESHCELCGGTSDLYTDALGTGMTWCDACCDAHRGSP